MKTLRIVCTILALVLFVVTLKAEPDRLGFESPVSVERLTDLKAIIQALPEIELQDMTKAQLYQKVWEQFSAQHPGFVEFPSTENLIVDVMSTSLSQARERAHKQNPDINMSQLISKAEAEFPAYVIGDKVSVVFSKNPARGRSVSGKIRSIGKTHVNIGMQSYAIAFFVDRKFREGLSLALTKKNRADYIANSLKDLHERRLALIERELPNYIKESVLQNERSSFIWNGRKWLSISPFITSGIKKHEQELSEKKEKKAKELEKSSESALDKIKEKIPLFDWF